MSDKKRKYGIDEVPPLRDNLLYGLQWLAVALPTCSGHPFVIRNEQYVYSTADD